jgi:hypothetical protein
MADGGRIRWWRVASHLWKPAAILTAAGGVPTIPLATYFVRHGRYNTFDVVLVLGALMLTGIVTACGLVIFLFAGFSVVAGRIQHAIWTWRSTNGKRDSDDAGPYR